VSGPIAYSAFAGALIDKFGNGEPVQQLLTFAHYGVAPQPSMANQAGDSSAMLGSAKVTKSIGGLTLVDKFKYGPASRKEMEGVRTELLAVAQLALRLSSTVDWRFYDGLRTMKEQVALKAAGKSKTLQSKHLTGDAMDLVPIRNGTPVWEWELIYPIAQCVDAAATELGFANKIRWGGAWDRVLSDFGGDAHAYKDECALYANRHPGKDFIDGPHFEWVG
jgi:peptidoglycan L-alanyl-D-glutamate endopeptidase CwlK